MASLPTASPASPSGRSALPHAASQSCCNVTATTPHTRLRFGTACRTATLDSLLDRMRPARVDVVKLDVEGSGEAAVRALVVGDGRQRGATGLEGGGVGLRGVAPHEANGDPRLASCWGDTGSAWDSVHW